jgi:hypothetical protein
MFALDWGRSCGKIPYWKTICRRMKSGYFSCSSLSFAMRMRSCGMRHVLGKCSVEMTYRMTTTCRIWKRTCKRRTTCVEARICMRAMTCWTRKTCKRRRISISLMNNPNGMDGCILMCFRMKICSGSSFAELTYIDHSCSGMSFGMWTNSVRGTVL